MCDLIIWRHDTETSHDGDDDWIVIGQVSRRELLSRLKRLCCALYGRSYRPRVPAHIPRSPLLRACLGDSTDSLSFTTLAKPCFHFEA
jgi:hypothetical protein